MWCLWGSCRGYGSCFFENRSNFVVFEWCKVCGWGSDVFLLGIVKLFIEL